jgi:hypothetical protein
VGIDPSANVRVVSLVTRDIPFAQIGCAMDRIAAVHASQVFEAGIKIDFAGCIKIHGFGDNADNSHVTVVVEEVVLLGDIFSKFLWILVLQLHWNKHRRRGQFRSPKA